MKFTIDLNLRYRKFTETDVCFAIIDDEQQVEFGDALFCFRLVL